MLVAMSTYHHGDLPSALRAATVELIAEKGTSGFSLRQVAKKAGVSHAAPAHHFGDVEGLLTAVATEGYDRLADEMSAAVDGIDDPRERLRQCGHAYVRVALENPGHFGVMLQNELFAADDPQLMESGARAYAVLSDTIAMVRDQLNPDLDVDQAATFCWSAVQGLVALTPNLDHVADHQGTKFTETIELIDCFCDLMINGLANSTGPS